MNQNSVTVVHLLQELAILFVLYIAQCFLVVVEYIFDLLNEVVLRLSKLTFLLPNLLLIKVTLNS
jgi:hypothetical protein